MRFLLRALGARVLASYITIGKQNALATVPPARVAVRVCLVNVARGRGVGGVLAGISQEGEFQSFYRDSTIQSDMVELWEPIILTRIRQLEEEGL